MHHHGVGKCKENQQPNGRDRDAKLVPTSLPNPARGEQDGDDQCGRLKERNYAWLDRFRDELPVRDRNDEPIF